jgi:hypothetical protein
MSAIQENSNSIIYSEEEFEKKLDLNLIADAFIKKKFHLALISLDLTYLNNVNENHELGDRFMKSIKSLLIKLTDSNLIQYHLQASGRFFIFSEKNLGDVKKQFFILEDIFTKEIKLNLNRKIIYFLDSSDSHLTDIEKSFFSIGPYQIEEKELIEEVFKLNFYLDKQRRYLQEAIKNNLKEDLSDLFQRENKLSEDIYSKKVQFNLKKFMNLESDVFAKEISHLKNTYNSLYISQILDQLQVKYYNETRYDKHFIFILGIKSLFFFQFQKISFILFKLEKVYKNFERITPKNQAYSRNPILLFERGDPIELRREKLLTWFNSSVKLLEPTFSLEQRNEYAKILEIINHTNEFSRSIQITLSQKIQGLFDTLHVSGFCSQSLSTIPFNGGAEKFMKWQFSIHHREQGEEYFEKYWKSKATSKNLENSIFKSKSFYAALSRPSLVPMMYSNLSKYFMARKWRLHAFFIELDAFNTFNFYQFVDETDKLYKEIISFMYDTAYSITQNNKNDLEILNMFSTMISSILGDEFYFFFLTENELSVKQKKILTFFMNSIKKKILDITKDFVFPKTQKILVSTQKGDIIFRKIVERNTFSEDFEIEVARVGVSGALITNSNLDFNNKFLQLDFDNFKKILEQCLNQVKKNKEPILIENKREKKKMRNSIKPSLMEFSISGKAIAILDNNGIGSSKFNFSNIFK